MSNYPLTDLRTELTELGIETELTDGEKDNLEFIEWKKQQDKKADRQLVRSILTNVGINPDGDINEQIQNY